MVAAHQPQAINNFLRAVKSCRPTTYRSIRTPQPYPRRLHPSAARAQTTYSNRYGPAATEGLPPPPKPAGSLAPKKEDVTPAEAQAKKSPQQESQQLGQSKQKEENKKQTETNRDVERIKDGKKDQDQNTNTSPLEQASAAVQARQETSGEKPLPPEEDPDVPLGNKELDIVLSVPAPSEAQPGKRHPHLEPSPYEHHFDTYSLVQQLASESDTFSEEQSITVMKAVRLMLTNNLDIAREGLISKSDIENESYLFRAACSELRTTMDMTRATENQKQRTQRAQLQHEHDILNQKVAQDLQTLREDLKGMFNDRKMGLQEEKRRIDSQISELNYEITVLLNSEAKSEVEGLRWVLTRRAALAIGTAAFMTLSALQYYSVKSREMAEVEKKRAAAKKAQEERMASEDKSRYTTPSRAGAAQQPAGYEESLG